VNEERKGQREHDETGGNARRRSRYAQERGDGTNLRIVVIVGAIALIAAALLFWNRRQEPFPSGIGEHLTVVTATDSTASDGDRPRSGAVDIGEHEPVLVPEGRQAGATDRPATNEPEPREQQQTAATTSPPPSGSSSGSRAGTTNDAASQTAATTGAAAPPAAKEPTTAVEPVAPEPGESGRWAVQIGAFGSEENAASLIAQLRKQGYLPRLRADSGSQGALFYRVWIGYFATRDDAERYARAHAADLGPAFPVHR
jgi:cell division septation protein DedD